MSTPTPFELHVGDDALADLKQRLARVRWPDELPDSSWKYGADLAYMKSLVDYWRDEYDWRKHEADINGLHHYKVRISGADLHYIRAEGRGPNPIPLLLAHGWPGSIHEFRAIIPMLSDPARFGGDPADAFTVIAPSLPGFTLSFTPGRRFSLQEIVALYAELMVDVLGFRKFGVQGGDWGAAVASQLAHLRARNMIGIHLNLLGRPREPRLPESPSEEERIYFEEFAAFSQEETGYGAIQATKPQTLSYALTDSPVGLASWIVEKFHGWSDHRGDLDGYLGKDSMLTNVMLYWLTGAIGSSFWPYYARAHGPWPFPEEVIRVPTGYAEFPREMLRPPRSIAEQLYGNIQRWTKMPRGGHFAALEQPELLAQEVRAFFRPLR